MVLATCTNTSFLDGLYKTGEATNGAGLTFSGLQLAKQLKFTRKKILIVRVVITEVASRF
jgi:hypothetical protein